MMKYLWRQKYGLFLRKKNLQRAFAQESLHTSREDVQKTGAAHISSLEDGLMFKSR